VKRVVKGILCLSITVPTVAMELQERKKQQKIETFLFIVTPEENQKFATYVRNKLSFCKTVTMADYVAHNNPIHKMLEGLSKDLKECNNDVLELITSKGLEQQLNNYEKVADANQVVTFCLEQIRKKEGDMSLACDLVAHNRQLMAEMQLHTVQPCYDYQYLEAVQIQDGIDYMNRNVAYPLDEDAVKDFIALLIYQVIFSHQTYKK
jgi:hypothetical protein